MATHTKAPRGADPQEVSGHPWSARWWALMDRDIGIIPIPIYILLVGLLIGFTAMDVVESDITMVIAVMAVFAFTLGEIGKRAPVIRNIGGAAVVVTFVPSYLNYKGWIPASNVEIVSDFFKSTNILYLFIAGVIVGSILSMDRTVLIKGFVKIFVPLAAGSIVAGIVGTAVGSLVGIGFRDTLYFIVAPIMAGGVGEGAVPLTLGYAQVGFGEQGELLAKVMPAILVGNLTAIILSGLLSYLGKKRPHLTGFGRLQPGVNDDLLEAEDTTDQSNLFSVQNIAAAMIVAVTLYLAGQMAHELLGLPGPVTMLFLAVLLKLAHGVTPRIQAGSKIVYTFFLTAMAFPMLFAFGLVLTPWEKLIEGFAPRNLITIVATVTALVITGFFTSKLVRIHPVEGAIITSTHSGMGGAGDIAILTASDRMRLMPFAQIATRIGGGLTVAGILALAAVWGM
ncbi:MAG: 2-hydroxycarboxylate transporter family protein [Comamonadaceae bacterium]|nr:MAG: 2-hydroxycarboxylate transporter family protein [Comamonadaceae bacterium]